MTRRECMLHNVLIILGYLTHVYFSFKVYGAL
jgi:hypothetical protein